MWVRRLCPTRARVVSVPFDPIRGYGEIVVHDGEPKGDRIIGLFNTCDEARAVGARRFLLEPYLIQQVRRHEPLHHHARYGPCPTSGVTFPTGRS